MRKLFLVLIPLVILVLAFRAITTHTITGHIRDANGAPITHATISEKGKKGATVSKTDGSYEIQVTNVNGKLVFSAAGYNTVEVEIKGQSVIDVTLQAAQASLQEVVVTGYSSNNELKKMNGNYAPLRRAMANSVSGVYAPQYQNFNTEDYDGITENGFHKASDDPLSTFSIDVDAASYSNVRRFLNNGQLPPEGAVRIEEMINYFKYDYASPTGQHPFSIHTELSDCPWNNKHKLALIGLQGKKIATENLPSSNIVFLIDVSGSMQHPLKLPLVKISLKLLVEQLREEDNIAVVVYAGAAGLVLPSTSGSEKGKIVKALDGLEAGGSTAGGDGIKLAYKIAKEHFKQNGNNRVILCTDGDFNVGISSDDELERLIEKERKSGVFLTVLGYGMGNYKDNKMQKLADKGNGNHAYIDGMTEAKKVLVNEFGGTLFTIAKDVKLQVEFNPAKVQGYRLIGYENRLLNKEDFNDDVKDAGELGSGHTVTALYEIIPAGVKSEFLKEVDPLKYQKEPKKVNGNTSEFMSVKFRYKKPDGDKSLLIEHPVLDRQIAFNSASQNLRFATAVAQFGMLLRNSEFKGTSTFESTVKLASSAKSNDTEGYRNEFINIVKKAAQIKEGIKKSDVVVNQ